MTVLGFGYDGRSPGVYRAYVVNSGFNNWLENCIGAGSGVGNERSSLRLAGLVEVITRR